MASVKLVDVNKSFDGNNMVVNGVNFSIGDGDFLVIVGPSGCGKSTTLNLIAGLDEVTSGQIYINDQLVNGVEPKDRNVLRLCLKGRSGSTEVGYVRLRTETDKEPLGYLFFYPHPVHVRTDRKVGLLEILDDLAVMAQISYDDITDRAILFVRDLDRRVGVFPHAPEYHAHEVPH